jgi:hypothetical protein
MADSNTERELFDMAYGRSLGYYYFNAHSQLRLHQSAFYEKIAILDGGTVALTITVVIDKIHQQIRHPFALKVGLICLILAMLSLFARNFFWTLYESKVMEMKFTNQNLFSSLTNIQEVSYPEKLFGFLGLLLTAMGMFTLVYVAVTLF